MSKLSTFHKQIVSKYFNTNKDYDNLFEVDKNLKDLYFSTFNYITLSLNYLLSNQEVLDILVKIQLTFPNVETIYLNFLETKLTNYYINNLISIYEKFMKYINKYGFEFKIKITFNKKLVIFGDYSEYNYNNPIDEYEHLSDRNIYPHLKQYLYYLMNNKILDEENIYFINYTNNIETLKKYEWLKSEQSHEMLKFNFKILITIEKTYKYKNTLPILDMLKTIKNKNVFMYLKYNICNYKYLLLFSNDKTYNNVLQFITNMNYKYCVNYKKVLNYDLENIYLHQKLLNDIKYFQYYYEIIKCKCKYLKLNDKKGIRILKFRTNKLLNLTSENIEAGYTKFTYIHLLKYEKEDYNNEIKSVCIKLNDEYEYNFICNDWIYKHTGEKIYNIYDSNIYDRWFDDKERSLVSIYNYFHLLHEFKAKLEFNKYYY